MSIDVMIALAVGLACGAFLGVFFTYCCVAARDVGDAVPYK